MSVLRAYKMLRTHCRLTQRETSTLGTALWRRINKAICPQVLTLDLHYLSKAENYRARGDPCERVRLAQSLRSPVTHRVRTAKGTSNI
jgi:hypothetical protein